MTPLISDCERVYRIFEGNIHHMKRGTEQDTVITVRYNIKEGRRESKIKWQTESVVGCVPA